MKNYYQLWEARNSIACFAGFEKADPRQTRVCRLPRPSTGVYIKSITKSITKSFTKSITKSFTKSITKSFTKSITKSFTKSITKSFMKTITQSIFEQEIAFWVNVHSTLVLSQTAFHTPSLMTKKLYIHFVNHLWLCQTSSVYNTLKI